MVIGFHYKICSCKKNDFSIGCSAQLAALNIIG
jgi:hypothetical protein